MPLVLPTLADIVDRERANVKANLPSSNPYEPTSFLNVFSTSFAGRMNELYSQVEIIKRDIFATTAQGQDLLDIGAVYSITLITPAPASGEVVFTGILGTSIPSGTLLYDSNKYEYTTTTTVTITANQVADITEIGYVAATGIATATCATAHGLATGQVDIDITGSSSAVLDGVVQSPGIIVLNTTDFTFIPNNYSGGDISVTGTSTADYESASSLAVSKIPGQEYNVVGGTELDLAVAIIDITNALTTYTGIDGGTDSETLEEFRIRLLAYFAYPLTPFNAANIIRTAKLVPGVTRVWVFEPDDAVSLSDTATITTVANDHAVITFTTPHGFTKHKTITVAGANEVAFNGTFIGNPITANEIHYYSSGVTGSATGAITVGTPTVLLGQTVIYFVRDNDYSIIPSNAEVTEVWNKVHTIKPGNMCDSNLFVLAPILKEQNFIFTSIVPDTPTMRESIEQNLQAMFLDIDMGEEITGHEYDAAIQNSFDSESGQNLQSFVLSTPTPGDPIIPAYNEILSLGSISYT